MALLGGKHVMLSYNHKSKTIVQTVYNILTAESIPTWFDERDMDDNMYDRYRLQFNGLFFCKVVILLSRHLVWLKQ